MAVAVTLFWISEEKDSAGSFYLQREARCMKKMVLIKRAAAALCCVCVIFGLGACAGGGEGEQGQQNGTYGSEGDRPLFGSRTTVFDHLEASDDKTISADFEVYLSEEEGRFLFIELNRDVDAVMEFTCTKDEGAAELGFDPGNGGERISFELGAGAIGEEAAYTENISLKKGMNIFYMAGDGCTCRISCRIEGVDPETRSYVSAFPKGS